MGFSYEEVAAVVQQGGIIYFFLIFCGVLAYALWPKNREKFDRAARIPFEED